MKITDETIAYTAALAKLELNETEREQARADLEKVLTYMERLGGADTGQAEPLSHVLPLFNVYREDTVTNTAQTEALLAGAPHRQANYYLTPKTVE